MDEIALKYQQLSAWLQTRLGQAFLYEEQKCLSSLLKDFLGDTLLIVGDFRQAVLAQNCKVRQHFVLSPYRPSDSDLNLCAARVSCVDYETLPIDQDSADVILLPHTLEFFESCDSVLRKVMQALRGEGYLVVIGFNPISLCGLRHVFSSKTIPWSASFRTLSQIEDRLAFLNFEIVASRYAFYRPPFGITANRWWKFLDYIGKYLLSPFGGIYLLVARKRVFGVTPLKAEWKKLSSVVTKGMVEPIRKEIHHE